MNFNRDGAMRHTIAKGKVNYWPNRFSANPPATGEEGGYTEYPQKVEGIKERAKSAKFKEHFSQAQLFYNSLSDVEKAHLTAALSFELDHCEEPIVYERLTSRLADIDLGLAQSVAEMVGGPVPQKAGRPNHGKKAKNLSQFDFLPENPTIATRKVGILIADGFDPIAFNGVYAALMAQKAIPVVLGPRRSKITSANGEISVQPDHHFEGQRSTMFDALFVPGGEQSIQTLAKNGRALHYIREAFGHLKAIGGTGEAALLFDKAFQLPEVSLSSTGEAVESYGVVTLRHPEPESLKEVISVAKNAKGFLDKFVYAISQHRCWARELDGLNTQVAY